MKNLSNPSILTITFRGNDLAIIGLTDFLEKSFPNRKDERVTYFFPRDFFLIIDLIKINNISFTIDFSYDFVLPEQFSFSKNFTLYKFQNEAVESWLNNSKKGIILLPTGAGKTIISLEIISILRIKTLIVVPTLVLLEQWKNNLIFHLGLQASDIGEFGGGKQEVKDITIITYDSAHLYVKRLRCNFGLLILDEAHHLAGTSYEIIADGYIAPYRLALTATIDQQELSYENLVTKGFDKVVYTLKPNQLQELEVLTNYSIETIKVKLENQEEYDRQIGILQNYLKRFSYNPALPPFKQLIFRINKDKDAQQALSAYQNAKNLSFSADTKLIELERLLRQHRDDKVLIFSDIVSFCEKIAKSFFIPCITHRTIKEERQWILEYYKRSKNAKLVVSKILDEGIDIPDAKIGIIVVGSGKSRQFIQRLGRIVRQYPGKDKAVLYELVSEDTLEERLANKRKKDF